MESEERYLRIGIAILLLGSLLGAGLYWLSGGLDKQVVKHFVTYFQTQSLEGLQISSDVRMQGIKVGKVIDYAIMPGEAHKVRVVLEVDQRAPVLEGVEAVVTRHLVTGLAAIDLENGDSRVPLEKVEEGEDYPRIPEGVPQMAKVASTLEELGQLGRETLSRINTLLSPGNQRALSGSLRNLEAMSAGLRDTLPEVRGTLVSTRTAVERFTRLGDQAEATLASTRHTLERVGEESATTLAAARATLATLDRNVQDLSVQLRMSADLSAQEIQSTAQSLRIAGDSLQETSRALGDPSRILYGANEAELGPGETQP